MSENKEIGKYVLPVFPSVEGIGPGIDRQMSRAFGDISKKASKALSDGFTSGVTEAEAAVKKSSDAISKLRDKEAASADKLRVAEERINEVRDKGGSALARAEAQRNSALRSQKQALSDIEAQTRQLTRAQEQLADAQKNGDKAGTQFLAGLRSSASGAASHGSDAAASFAEGFAGSSALLRLGSAAGPIGLALAAAGAVAGGVLVKNVMAGIEREPARDLVQAQLGIDEATMAKLGQVAAKAYTDNWGDSVESNLDTAKVAIQTGLLSGADDPGAQRIVENLTAVKDLIGEEIPSVARSAGQLIKTGLADSADQAFDLIVKGQQAGLNISGDWLDTLNEYGTQFRKLGISGPESVGLISQALKGGARDSDVAADALKEFSIRAVDGSKLTRQAYRDLGFDADAMSAKMAAGGPAAREGFGQILDAIRGIQDPLQQSQVAIALFGTQAEDLGGAFSQFDLSRAVDQLGQVDGAAQAAADTMGDNTAASFESAKRSIETSLQVVQDKLAAVFGPELEKAANFVTEHGDDITGVFVAMAQGTVRGLGTITEAFGGFVGGIGNVVGAMDKFQAWQADFRGDHETAAQLREQAEEAFGWGEGLQQLGADMVDSAAEMGKWRDSLKDAGSQADTAKSKTKLFGDELGSLPGQKDVKLNVTDGLGNQLPLIGSAIAPGTAAASGVPSLFGSAAAPSSGSVGPTLALTGSISGLPAGLAPSKNLTPGAENLNRLVSAQFPHNTGGIGGWRQDAYEDHPSGEALDIMVGGNKALGDSINKWLLDNADALGLKYTIWQHGQWDPGGKFTEYPDRGSPTANHMDHVHARVKAGGGSQMMLNALTGPGAGTVVSAAPSTGPGPAPSAPAGAPSLAATPHGAGGQLTNAYGPGYEPGIGTPGYDEYGEPGYYRTDPKALREADQRRIDAQDAIAAADSAAAQARARREELDPDADQSAVLAADEAVRSAEERARKARREAADAETDYAEAQKGKFTAARKGAKSGKGAGGDSELGELGSIAGSFLKETFGLDGSVFPDISQLGIVKMANALLGVKFNGGGEGEDTAGGWPNPFAPAADAGMAASPAASGLPFGMIPSAIDAAGRATPGMAPPVASGIGAGPAPGPVDMSRNVNIQVDSGPTASQIGDTVRREVNNVDRLRSYTPKGP